MGDGGGSGGIRMVRNVFNAIAEPAGYACSEAFMRLSHAHDVEWQELEFRGIGPDGMPFVIISDLVPAKDDIFGVAEATARKFVKMKQETATKPPPATPDPVPAKAKSKKPKAKKPAKPKGKK